MEKGYLRVGSCSFVGQNFQRMDGFYFLYLPPSTTSFQAVQLSWCFERKRRKSRRSWLATPGLDTKEVDDERSEEAKKSEGRMLYLMHE